jgi:hypothetical protein
VAKQRAHPVGAPGDSTAPHRSSSASSDHWKRLLRRPPREPIELGPEAFVDELNRRLHADSACDRDTCFVVVTDDEGQVVGTTWRGPDAMKPVIARIVKSVIGEYEAGGPFIFDR